jgi:plasmid stabilization system protein ParE
MGLPVILTPQSQDDLGIIVRRIAADNPERARAFGNELIDHALSIGSMPERGRIVPELREPSVREIIHGSYRIIYEVLAEPRAVFVLRFWHAARGTPDVPRQKPSAG